MTLQETIKIVEKLIELTQHNQLTWRASSIQISLPSYEKVDTCFSVEHLNKNIRIYKYFYQVWTEEDSFYWAESIRLEFYNNNTLELEFRFPETSNMLELLNTIMYKTSNVEEFYDNLFK